jgi:hypothetical protein
LASLKSVYGLAGSVEELQNQVDSNKPIFKNITQTAYRLELLNYTTSHNMKLPLPVNQMETFQLELLVKAHMIHCQYGLSKDC